MTDHISIQQIHIDETQLKQDEYFASLLKEAYRTGAISENEIVHIQMACLRLLEAKSKKYTGRDSSIPADDAENILKSIAYTIGLYLKSSPTPLDAIEAIKKTPLPELYAEGRKKLRTKTGAAQIIYQKVLTNITGIGYEYYLITLTEEIRRFFGLYTDYYTEYHAHEVFEGLFSYQLRCPMNDLVGIEYVQRYLQAVYYENIFCKCFPDEAIHHFLSRKYTDYNQAVFNICQEVLMAAVRCVIAGADVRNLLICDEGMEEYTEEIILRAYDELISKLGLGNPQVQAYLKQVLLSPFP